MKKYDNYKDSGIEWIGEIPEHWEIQRLKHAFDLGTGLSITKENLIDKGVPCVNYGEIHSKCGFEVDINKHNLKCVDLDYLNTSKKALMKQGEFIFADTSEDIEGSGNFTHIKRDGDIFAGYHTVTVRPLNIPNSLYFAFLFDSIDYRTQIRNSVKGIKVFSITQGILKNTFIWSPPLEEQTAIANYLDHKTTQIDHLITQKEQLIALLQEERTAVINQAVTKGLDPTVQLKDSGIEWLGEIPEHWEVKKLKYICNLINERAIEKPDYIIALENISNWTGEIIGNPFQNKMEGDAILFESNDILFNKLRPYLAKVLKTERNGGCVGELLVLRAKEEIDSDFLYQRLSSEMIITIVDNSTYGTKMPRASWDKFISLIEIGVPPISEQKEIANYINNKISDIKNIISKTQQEIELLKEYKTALISEVVTGKVDVREAVLN